MKKMFVFGLAAAALFCFVVASAYAEERAPQKRTIVGMVSVTKDAAAAVTAIKVTVKAPAPKEGQEARPDMVFNVTLDDNGKKVAELDGKKASVTGTITRKGEGDKAERWITVESSKEATEDKPKDKPAEK